MKIYTSDKVLEEFYGALASNEPDKLQRVHIPISDVFYVRRKYYMDTGIWETLDRIERSMYLEGMLRAEDVFEPEVPRDWELEDRKKMDVAREDDGS